MFGCYWPEEKYTNCPEVALFPLAVASLLFIEFMVVMETLRVVLFGRASALSWRLWRRRMDVERTKGVVCLIMSVTRSCNSLIFRSFCRINFSKSSICSTTFQQWGYVFTFRVCKCVCLRSTFSFFSATSCCSCSSRVCAAASWILVFCRFWVSVSLRSSTAFWTSLQLDLACSVRCVTISLSSLITSSLCNQRGQSYGNTLREFDCQNHVLVCCTVLFSDSYSTYHARWRKSGKTCTHQPSIHGCYIVLGFSTGLYMYTLKERLDRDVTNSSKSPLMYWSRYSDSKDIKQ